MANMKIKKGDKVRVTTGKDKGKEGKVLVVDKKENRVIVEGINLVTKHAKPNQGVKQGGIIHKEAAIHVSNVVYLHKGKPTKIGMKIVQEEKNGKVKNVKYRVAKSTNEVID